MFLLINMMFKSLYLMVVVRLKILMWKRTFCLMEVMNKMMQIVFASKTRRYFSVIFILIDEPDVSNTEIDVSNISCFCK